MQPIQSWQGVAQWSAIGSIAAFVATVIASYVVAANSEARPCQAKIEIAAEALTDIKSPRVVGAFPQIGRGTEEMMVGFGNSLCVAVAKLELRSDQAPLILYLNNEPMRQIVGRVADRAKGHVLFQLAPKSEDMESWRRAIGFPKFDGQIQMSIGVGTATAEFERVANIDVKFLLFSPVTMMIGLLGILLALVVVITLARKTSLLRDGDKDTCYSLARCQMAWWLFLITGAFIYIWLVTGEYNGIVTPDALVLLGISATTGLAAIAIGQPAGGAGPGAPSTDFLRDILYDDAGPTVHRIQIVVWTLLLGGVFLAQIYSTFRFPKFDTNLLIMMGISGGFYLGFKAKEK